MAARTSVAAAADVTVEAAFQFGGQSSKKRKMVTFVLAGSTSNSTTDTPWNIGSTDGDFPASAFGFNYIESCSNLAIFTTATGAVVRIAPATPSLKGQGVLLTDTGATAGAVTDIALAYTESARITLVGY